MGSLLAGLGWCLAWLGFFGGLAILFNAEELIEAWRDVSVKRRDRGA